MSAIRASTIIIFNIVLSVVADSSIFAHVAAVEKTVVGRPIYIFFKVCFLFGPTVFGPMAYYRTNGSSNRWVFGPMSHRTNGPSDHRHSSVHNNYYRSQWLRFVLMQLQMRLKHVSIIIFIIVANHCNCACVSVANSMLLLTRLTIHSIQFNSIQSNSIQSFISDSPIKYLSSYNTAVHINKIQGEKTKNCKIACTKDNTISYSVSVVTKVDIQHRHPLPPYDCQLMPLLRMAHNKLLWLLSMRTRKREILKLRMTAWQFGTLYDTNIHFRSTTISWQLHNYTEHIVA